MTNNNTNESKPIVYKPVYTNTTSFGDIVRSSETASWQDYIVDDNDGYITEVIDVRRGIGNLIAVDFFNKIEEDVDEEEFENMISTVSPDYIAITSDRDYIIMDKVKYDTSDMCVVGVDDYRLMITGDTNHVMGCLLDEVEYDTFCSKDDLQIVSLVAITEKNLEILKGLLIPISYNIFNSMIISVKTGLNI